MDPILKKAYEACQKGQSFAFATIVENTAHGTPRKSGAKMIVLNDGTIEGTIGGGLCEKATISECQNAIRSQKSKFVTYKNFGGSGQPICGGKFSVFIEPFAGTKHMIICGAGHIALPLSVIAKILNFRVTILDDRPEFTNKERFPHVDKILVGNPPAQLSKLDINGDTYIVIVTHGHEWDFACLKKTVHSKAAYIGVIGSKSKKETFLKALQRVPGKNIKISMPIGLDIGAQTPEEIAVAIAAEIIGKCNKAWQNSPKFLTKRNVT